MTRKTEVTRGQRIRQIRGDLTQTMFADLLGIRQAMISRYEADKETPSPENLLRLANYAGRSMEWILTGNDSTDGPQSLKKPSKQAINRMSREEALDLATSIVEKSGHPFGKDFGKIMRACFKDMRLMEKVVSMFNFFQYEEKKKK